MTSFCFPPQDFYYYFRCLPFFILAIGRSRARALEECRGRRRTSLPGSMDVRPGPTGLKNLKSLLTKSQTRLLSPIPCCPPPCVDCVCGAPIDRILTTIIMIQKSNNYKRVNDDDADVDATSMMMLLLLMMMDLMELMWAAMNHCNVFATTFQNLSRFWAQSLAATFIDVFFSRFPVWWCGGFFKFRVSHSHSHSLPSRSSSSAYN